jgi:adenylate kinase
LLVGGVGLGVALYIVLLGAPGAGKGTQAPVLASRLGVLHVASGDIFREHLRNGTEYGLLARSYMEKGQLVPDDVTIRMIMERIARPDAARGAVLDGFPRTLEQAKALDASLGICGESVDKVLYLSVPRAELMRRLSGRWNCRQCHAVYHQVYRPPKRAGICDVCGGELFQRPDDAIETVRNRLAVYFRETAPLIEYYAEKGVLAEIDGELDIAEVEREMLSIVQRGR